MRTCKICATEIEGRSNKIFCAINCKNYYHTNLRRVTKDMCTDIDRILHRNRSILLEVMGKNLSRKKVTRLILDKKKFNFKYSTHSYINSQGKTYRFLYDFGWMEFTDQEVIIIRVNSKRKK